MSLFCIPSASSLFFYLGSFIYSKLFFWARGSNLVQDLSASVFLSYFTILPYCNLQNSHFVRLAWKQKQRCDFRGELWDLFLSCNLWVAASSQELSCTEQCRRPTAGSCPWYEHHWGLWSQSKPQERNGTSAFWQPERQGITVLPFAAFFPE